MLCERKSRSILNACMGMVENQVVSEVYTKLELGKSCVVGVHVHVFLQDYDNVHNGGLSTKRIVSLKGT